MKLISLTLLLCLLSSPSLLHNTEARLDTEGAGPPGPPGPSGAEESSDSAAEGYEDTHNLGR